jgi:SRSO17 transposase
MIPMLNEAYENNTKNDIYNPQRWGLPIDAVYSLGNRLMRVWSRFRGGFKTQTRDTSEYVLSYLRGVLSMDSKRNFANIARRVIDLSDDGQNLQQFMSDSPWSAQGVFDQIQAEIINRDELQGGMLTLDESGDEKAGNKSAGAGRQYLGRIGKVDMGQVGVALGYYQANLWCMVDAELFLPENWFDEAHQELRTRWHIPADRTFQRKPKIGLDLIRRAKANGLPFEVVSCDALYGQSSQFRADVDDEGLIYMADIPSDIMVYQNKPEVGIPRAEPGKKGRPPSRPQVLSQDTIQVREIVHQPDFKLQPIQIRDSERGPLIYECFAQRVWTVTEQGRVRQEWLFIRREADGTFSYSLSNASEDTPLAKLALWRCERYFAERIFQDAKSEGGWDELVARKYRAWMHHTALDALALWFIAETKLDWAQAYPRDPQLIHQLEVEVLPALSMANVREMIKAVLPLNQLSPEQATHLVIQHLVNRSHSTRSRLKTHSTRSRLKAKPHEVHNLKNEVHNLKRPIWNLTLSS